MNKYLIVLFITCVILFVYIIATPDEKYNCNNKRDVIYNAPIYVYKSGNNNASPNKNSVKFATNAPDQDSYLEQQYNKMNQLINENTYN